MDYGLFFLSAFLLAIWKYIDYVFISLDKTVREANDLVSEKIGSILPYLAAFSSVLLGSGILLMCIAVVKSLATLLA
jgi:hypothetical protein